MYSNGFRMRRMTAALGRSRNAVRHAVRNLMIRKCLDHCHEVDALAPRKYDLWRQQDEAEADDEDEEAEADAEADTEQSCVGSCEECESEMTEADTPTAKNKTFSTIPYNEYKNAQSASSDMYFYSATFIVFVCLWMSATLLFDITTD